MSALRRLMLGAVIAISSSPALAQKVGMLEIKGAPLSRPGELSWLMGSAEPTLRELVNAIIVAGDNDQISHLVIRLKDAELGRTQVEELGAAIAKVRQGGKQVVLFSEGYGPGDLVLGSYADRILIQSGGPVSLPGMYMEEMYLADTLAWIGLKADLVQVGDYKGANETMVNSKPSEAWNQNIDQLLDSLYGQMREELKKGRKLSDEQLDAAMQKAWLADDQEAVAAGLVDTSIDLPELGKAVTGKESPRFETIEAASEGSLAMGSGNPMAEMMAMMQAFSQKPSHKPKGPTIAVVHVDGVIIDGDSSAGGFFGEGGVGSRTIRNALEEVRDEDLIKGVIVRIDSPGGSATASEVIWQGVKRVAEKKPVWVSVGSLAASGGYYIAVGADKIYLNPSSVVGSIGVVGGKISMGGLYELAKINVVGRGRGPRADLFASDEPWSESELALVRDKMKRTFDLFTKRVASGREGIDLSKTAGGWLFAGQKAIDMRMADKIGGLDKVLDDLAAQLELNDFDVMDYPAPRSLPEILEEAFKGFGLNASGSVRITDAAAALKTIVGPRAWPAARSALGGLMLIRDEPIVLVLPRAIIVR